MNDFKGTDTLLFACDQEGIRRIARICEVISHDRSAVNVNSIADATVAPLQQVNIVPDDAASSEVRISRSASEIKIEWCLGRAEALRCKDILIGMLDSNRPVHAYLEEVGDVTIMASIGEYPLDIIEGGEQPGHRS